ncbi:MAG: HAMP domain-containing histidine kinase [Clostridia bacterium]|nr:HAMP domain-containing histidine kinase [Clostridia bacterium]
MKKYPNSVMKGLLTALLFVMVAVTVFGFIVTAAAVSGDVYDTPQEELWETVGESLYKNFRNWAMYEQIMSVVSDALNVVYTLRYAAPFLCIGGLLLTVLLFCRLMRAAGHRNGAQEITLSKFDRIPFEIAAVLMIGIPVGIHLMLYTFTQGTLFERWYFGADPLELSVFVLLLSPFVYALCHTLAVRLKARTFWKSTLVYRIFWCLPKRLASSVKNAGRRDEAGNIVLQWYDKIPLEIVAAVLLVLPFPFEVFLHDVVLSDFLVSLRNYRNAQLLRGVRPFGYYIYSFFNNFSWIFVLTAAVILLWLFAYTVSVRIKCGTLWTNTLTYRLRKLLKTLFRHLNHAGRRNGSGEVIPTWIDKIPLEIVLLAAFLLGVLVLWIADWLIYTIRADFVAFLFLLIGWGTLLYGLAYLISVRIQLSTLWTNTLVYRIYKKCSGVLPRICRSIPLTWRTGLAVVLYMFITFLILAFSVDPRDIAFALILWFPMTLLFGALLIYGSWATHTITQILRDMAGGNIHKKTDPSKFRFIFRKQAEHLNSLGDGLQAAVQAQMKSERLKTELITNVSHDIKTPLTSIINYSDLLLAELGHEIQPDGKAAEYAETIHRHSLRLKKLTEDLVEASKAASGAITVNFERIELNQMLRQAVGEYEERLTAAGLTPVCRFTDEDVFLSADGRLLWRVFDNLLSNIVKYSLEGTRVYITLTKTGDRAAVSFKNISRDTLNVDVSELMERFVRGDASRHSEGSGLGLNIALSLCERMNGRLTLACDGDLFRADAEFPTIE